MRRRTLFLVLSVAAPVAALAQPYPSKPIRIIVPFSAATAADIAARQLGPLMAPLIGQSFVIENQLGAGGNIGAASVAKAEPDGYTLMMVGINHVINPFLYKEVPYDMLRDYKPIGKVGLAPLAFVANPSFPANNVTELVALAKAKPGDVHYGSGGNGSVTQLSLELLKSRAGIRMTHVPYKGIAQMMTDILGNQIPLGSPALASAVPQIRAGKLKILAVTSGKRSSLMPEAPTVAEAGFPGFDVSAWNGLLAPAKTPDDVVAKLYAAMAKAAATREYADALAKQGMEVDLLGPAEFRTFIAAELDKWAKLVKDSGAKLD